MALEINGLKAKALKARGHIDALNTAYDKFNEAAPAHAADVEGLVEQLTGMQDDLNFAVTTLGNSVVEAKPQPLSVVPQAETPASDPPAVWARLGP